MIARVSVAVTLCLVTTAAPATAAETLHYAYGPITIKPGQNTIALEENTLKPPVDGWITGFRPNLVRKDGTGPARRRHPPAPRRVDQALRPQFAAGEEKTALMAPPGYGWRHRTTDRWLMNHMIHNLTPTPRGLHHLRPSTSSRHRARPRRG